MPFPLFECIMGMIKVCFISKICMSVCVQVGSARGEKAAILRPPSSRRTERNENRLRLFILHAFLAASRERARGIPGRIRNSIPTRERWP